MTSWLEPTRLVATCPRGCAALLETELRALGWADARALGDDAVETSGDLRSAMRLNLWSRIAGRVLFEVAGFEAPTADALYEGLRDLPWEDWLRLDRPMHWHVAGDGPDDARFAALRAKDAVADRLRDRLGRRPDASPDPSGAACLVAHRHDGGATVYLDTTGVSLSRRGYRAEPWAAPVRETLAAAALLASGWDPDGPAELVAPMCGSGTFAIEAAWMAARRAPGLARATDHAGPGFAFAALRDAPLDAWRALVDDALAAVRPLPPGRIRASDIAPAAVACARRNAGRAGVADAIDWRAQDFREERPGPGDPAGTVLALNPEYGERLGDRDALPALYRSLGDWLKRDWSGARAVVLAGGAALARAVGLRPARRFAVWNGPIECRLLLYELWDGTRDRRLLAKHGGPA